MSSELKCYLSAGYGNKTIITNASFEVKTGELVAIVGANGCGKTTLLKSICGILPHTGEVYLGGVRLEKLSVKDKAGLITYVPQKSGIMIDITVLDVVLMGFNPRLGMLQNPTGDMIDCALKAIARVGLSGMESHNYLTLSEGQKQLCIWARAFVSQAKLMLLDEPESSLDFQYRYEMIDALREWISADEREAIVILHDINMALNCCDKIILIVDGTILDIITPGIDSLDKIEKALIMIYGPVSLVKCVNKAGKEQIVMLK